MLWTAAVAAVAMSIGVAARLATVTTFARRHLQPVPHDDALPPQPRLPRDRARRARRRAEGRELSVDAWWRARSGRPPLDPTAPAWPLWLLRFEAVTVYGASGLSKLLDRDWFGGTVTWHRVGAGPPPPDRVAAAGVGSDLLTDRSFHTIAAKVIVATELFIALGLCWQALRLTAVWVAVVFHVSIQLIGLGRGVLLPRRRRARDLGRALDRGTACW